VASDPRKIARQPTREELARASAAEGVSIPNVVARGTLAKRVAAGLQATFVGGPLRTGSQESITGIAGRLNEVADKYSKGLTERSAGELARASLAEWISTGGRGSEITQRLFDNVRRLIRDKNALNPLAATKETMDGLTGRQFAAASKVNDPAIDLIREAVERSNGLTFQGLMDLRTQIGHLIDGTIMPAPGTPMPALKQIYGALTNDLRSAAQRLGGEKATKAFDQAVDVSGMVADRRKDFARIVGIKGDDPPEAVLSRIVAMAKQGSGSADAATLLKARREIGDDWGAVAGAVIRQLGRDGDDFSPRRFLKNYQNLSANGRQILFRNAGKENLAESLDNLATLSSKLDELARLGNPSGTGNVVSLAGVIAGAVHNPLTALGAAGFGWLMARALAKPLTAKATSRWANAYLVNATAPTRNAMASLNLATQMFARSMAREGMGEEDDLRRKLDAASRGQR
jgi:hypothetical protein